jgi:hypothetical protein
MRAGVELQLRVLQFDGDRVAESRRPHRIDDGRRGRRERSIRGVHGFESRRNAEQRDYGGCAG